VLNVIIFGKTYLITNDLAPTLERKIGIFLDSDVRSRVISLGDEFIDAYWNLFRGDFLKTKANALETSIRIMRRCSQIGDPVVSLDRVYAPGADAYIEVTRITNSVTGKVTIGPRPGFASLEEQVGQIESSGITLVDVGAFLGTTLLEVCNILEDQRIEVNQIVIGYSSFNAIEKLRQAYTTEALELYDFFGWGELRDLVGIDGRRVPGKSGFIPYWENLEMWTPVEQSRLQEARELCLSFNGRLLGYLEGSGCDITKIGTTLCYEGEKK
jgi:hypothetical protein